MHVLHDFPFVTRFHTRRVTKVTKLKENNFRVTHQNIMTLVQYNIYKQWQSWPNSCKKRS